MLMHLSDVELDLLYPPSSTIITRTGRGSQSGAALREQLLPSRKRGYAIDDQMTTPGIMCIGAPVFSGNNRVVAAVGVTFVRAATDAVSRDRLALMVKDSAQVLSGRLGWREVEPTTAQNTERSSRKRPRVPRQADLVESGSHRGASRRAEDRVRAAGSARRSGGDGTLK
jgi:hypothetical protein